MGRSVAGIVLACVLRREFSIHLGVILDRSLLAIAHAAEEIRKPLHRLVQQADIDMRGGTRKARLAAARERVSEASAFGVERIKLRDDRSCIDERGGLRVGGSSRLLLDFESGGDVIAMRPNAARQRPRPSHSELDHFQLA